MRRGRGTALHYQHDAQGCTEALSDEAGDVLGPYGYRAFGLIANASMSGWADLSPDLWASMGVQDWYDLPVGPQSNFAGFGQKGAYLDPETQLYLMGSGGGSARYYDPVTGRFISEDRIGLAGGDPNLFRYCGNDPVNLRDPSGRDSEEYSWGTALPIQFLIKNVYRPAINFAADKTGSVKIREYGLFAAELGYQVMPAPTLLGESSDRLGKRTLISTRI